MVLFGTCNALSYIPLQKICWCPNTQNFPLWSYLEIGFISRVNQVKMINVVWVPIQYDWCSYEKRNSGPRDRHIQGRNSEGTQGEEATVSQKERARTHPSLTALRRNQPWCQTSSSQNCCLLSIKPATLLSQTNYRGNWVGAFLRKFRESKRAEMGEEGAYWVTSFVTAVHSNKILYYSLLHLHCTTLCSKRDKCGSAVGMCTSSDTGRSWISEG